MSLRSILVLAVTAACGGVISGADSGAQTDSGTQTDAPSSSCSCSSSQYCKHDKTCGSTAGTCTPRPNACPDLYAPVCAYGGTVFPNECTANAAGFDVDPSGGCIPPAGWISCGPGFCDAKTSYCQSTGEDAIGPGVPCTDYVCSPLPSACVGSQDCDCFGTSTPCASSCKWDGSGFQIMCFGG